MITQDASKKEGDEKDNIPGLKEKHERGSGEIRRNWPARLKKQPSFIILVCRMFSFITFRN